MPQSAAAASASTTAVTAAQLLADGPGRGLGVELVRVVEHGGLGGARRLPVVMDGDGVQELRPNRGVERDRPLLDQPQTEMDVTEQAPLLGLAERRPAAELERAPDVVQQRGGERGGRCAGADGAAPSRDRASRRRRCARAARPRSRGDRPLPRREAPETQTRTPSSPRMLRDDRREPVVGDLAGEEVEEAVELVRVAPHRRRQLGRIAVRRGLDRAHLHLEPAAEPLHASEHADGVAFGEAAVEQLDVVPDAGLDPPARVDELEGEVGRAVLRPPALLAADGEHALDGAILRELGDAGHAGSLGGPGQVRSGRGRCCPVPRDSLRAPLARADGAALRRADAGGARRTTGRATPTTSST